jgi:hypothetical protein
LKDQKIGSESNFDVVQLSVDGLIVLNWNLTLISLPLLVEASLDRKPSNEGSFFRPAGREKAGDETGGNKPACAAKYAINKIAVQAMNTPAMAKFTSKNRLKMLKTYQATNVIGSSASPCGKMRPILQVWG